jgi:Bacterial SH3 domain
MALALALAVAPNLTGCAAHATGDDSGDDLGEGALESDADELSQSGPTRASGTKLVTTKALNLRANGALGAKIVRTIPAGTQVNVWKASGSNAWVAVEYRGSRGYAHGDYLVRNEEAGADGSPAPQTDATAPEWISFAWDGKHRDAAKWNAYTRDAIREFGSAMVGSRPDDVADFCPKYGQLVDDDKVQFWIGLIAAMAKFESNWDPSVQYTEDFEDSSGNNVVSRGLLQISKESARNYGCEVPSASALHDAKVNLACTVKIINRWIDRDNVITEQSGGWKGPARYWSVLRKSSTLGPIQAMTRKLSVCK